MGLLLGQHCRAVPGLEALVLEALSDFMEGSRAYSLYPSSFQSCSFVLAVTAAAFPRSHVLGWEGKGAGLPNSRQGSRKAGQQHTEPDSGAGLVNLD